VLFVLSNSALPPKYCISPPPMKYRREFMNQWLTFALALSVCGLSLNCLAICAGHAERSYCAPDETDVALIGQEDECCPLDALRSAPPERIQKTPAGGRTPPLRAPGVFHIYPPPTFNRVFQSAATRQFAAAAKLTVKEDLTPAPNE